MFEQNTTVELSNSTFNKFLGRVFAFVGLGVLVSALMGYAWLNVAAFRGVFAKIVLSGFGVYLVFGVQIAIVAILRSAIEKGNLVMSFLVYILYAITVSLTFAVIGLIFSSQTIYKAFFTAFALFGLLSFIGLTTKVDLTRFSSLFAVGLIALVITSLLNVFIFRGTWLELIISIVGLVLFLGITAFDVQKLKHIYYENQHDSSALKVYSIYGAFKLYLDFINIFFNLVRLFGRND